MNYTMQTEVRQASQHVSHDRVTLLMCTMADDDDAIDVSNIVIVRIVHLVRNAFRWHYDMAN